MHSSIIKFIAIALGAAFLAVLGLFRRAFRTGEDPSDDGPRALVAEFIGLWIGTFCLIWSFTVDGKNLQWDFARNCNRRWTRRSGALPLLRWEPRGR
jgi:hypothetical protein